MPEFESRCDDDGDGLGSVGVPLPLLLFALSDPDFFDIVTCCLFYVFFKLFLGCC